MNLKLEEQQQKLIIIKTVDVLKGERILGRQQ